MTGQLPVLAVLADTHKNWKPTFYGFTVLGCKLSLEFPLAKLTDYEERLDELLESDNVFGWITAAHILTQKTRKQHQERYAAKIRLVRILYQRHWEKQRIIDLLYCKLADATAGLVEQPGLART